MATVTEKPRLNLVEAQRRVRHPLERVRNTIRLYVGLESAALLVILLACWFWVDVTFDYGFFRTLSIDWVQEIPLRATRAVLLGTLFVGILLVVQMLFFNLVGEELRGLLRTQMVSRPGGKRLSPVAEALAVAATVAVTAAIAWDAHLGSWVALGTAVVVVITVAVAVCAGGLVFLAARAGHFATALAIVAALAYLGGWRIAGGLAESVGPWLTAVLIFALLAGPVVIVALRRLLHDFRDDAIALVLERRFPKELGDRLITAVELADARKTTTYGYSRIMVENTIHDAAERVDRVPVQEIFDWKRLYRLGLLVALFTLGVYLLAGGVFCASDQIRGTGAPPLAGFSRFHDVAGLWFERNVQLQNSIWPRQAYLEVLDWPKNGIIRIGKDSPAPPLRVRALKWVIAAPNSLEGWRVLTWTDLVKRSDLLGENVPENAVPNDWGQPRSPEIGWTLDEIEMRLDRSDVHATLASETHTLFREVLTKLGLRAKDPALRRTLRQLKVPDTATVSYRGASGGGEIALQRQADNEYTGQFPELKENISFLVRGEDYYTRRLQILVVPIPTLVDLVVEEYRPAYIYYRTRDSKPEILKGKKQALAGRQISLFGGDTSRIDPVPTGTDLVLTATSDKELQRVRIPPPRQGVAEVKADVELLDSFTFRVRFDKVRPTPERPTYDFYFELLDTHDVIGRRHIVIKPIDDAVPDVDVAAEVVRKTSQGYMVTPMALVPIHLKVNDDYGLDTIEYACTVSRIDRGAEMGLRGLLLMSALQLALGGPGQEFGSVGRLASLARESQTPGKPEPSALTKQFPVVPFEQYLKSLRDQRREYVLQAQILGELDKKRSEPAALTRFYELIASEKDPLKEPESFFNVERLGLRVDEKHETQPRYRMQLWVEAVDNDIETGPHRGPSKEKLTFLIVSENELLSEIAKEEETLYLKLADRVKNLQDGMAKLDRLKEDLTSAKLTPEQLSGMTVRTDELTLILEKAEGIVGEVLTDYKRVLQELITNRVQQAMIDRVKLQICNPLELAISADFPEAKGGLAQLRKTLENKDGDLAARVDRCRSATDQARDRIEVLIRNLVGVLDKMQQLADINMLIKMVREIEEEEVRQETVLRKIRDQLQGDLLKGLEKEKNP